ncbi:patatin-like phospholipase family protein [Pseudoxanthomonas suwonensis]|uniref:RpoH suppressor n=1 Tax=Pseudoxanthomonas suwonensis TaxID=314722 RepID=A0A0E3UND7_9GAMM|nr:patatin-like phospholipase family protein [Pseudoxanthomonas suwonensis]AKC86870.1 RpoH suppressor [Pseudoxanthomonas suwonensis]
MGAHPEKYCDLVMKGGVTSGIVYPNAVLELAKSYRFKSIGGTSAGAIAAAVTAAAAVGDRRQEAGEKLGPDAGFNGMANVARQLSSKGFIYCLFQPANGATNAFRLVVLLAGHAKSWRKLLGVLVAVVAIAPLEFLAILAALCTVGYWIEGWGGAKAAMLPALLCAYGGAATLAVARTARVARRNLLGLCSGLSGRRAWPWRRRPLALTEWLHQTLQALAGKPEGEPLTFGDLWSAPRYGNEPESGFSINLQVITTGVSHREPRTLPFANKNFWFREGEFRRLFPASVVEWMIRAEEGAPLVVDGEIYHRLPEGDRFPVLVATRMSLSFPLLISAVPLHEPAMWARRPDTATSERGEDVVDEDAEAQGEGANEHSVLGTMEGLASGGRRRTSDVTAMRICWFSDGGISSNFPIHLFDAGLPLWPTFAINLRYPPPDPDMRWETDGEVPLEELEAAVFLPESNNQGWKHAHHPIASEWAPKEVAGFLFGIVGTMQNWRDLLQSRAPGHRDRIVHVSLQGTEGGMNLDMPAPVLERIAKKGAIAGRRFAAFSFENHYWVRWRNLSAAVQNYTVEFADNTTPERWLPPYAAACGSPLRDEESPSYAFKSEAAARRARDMHKKLHKQGKQWKKGVDLSKGAPNPAPQLRITPTF